MVRKALIQKEKKRKGLVDRHAGKRAEFKKIIRSHSTSIEEKLQAVTAMERLPVNSSRVRMRNRCHLSGRPRGFLRYFGMSRIDFRHMANNGLVPGVTKASW